MKDWIGGASISKTYTAASGYSYRTKLTAKIYTSSGSYVETLRTFSGTVKR